MAEDSRNILKLCNYSPDSPAPTPPHPTSLCFVKVEMFLLGYTLECTIQVYRLYKADTEEFVTYYPDDHKADWPSVCLVTEDDRHYNVPNVEATERAEADSSRSPLRRDGLLL